MGWRTPHRVVVCAVIVNKHLKHPTQLNNTIYQQPPQGLHVRLDLSTGQRMGKLMDPEEAVAAPGKANATGGGGEHIVILDDGEGGPAPKRRKAKSMLRGEEEDEPVRTEGEVSGADARSPQETMEAVLLKLPESEKEAMGIDALYAVRGFLGFVLWGEVVCVE